jgi:hypothetical protein
MRAEVLSYEPVASDRAINVSFAVFEDTGEQVETAQLVMPADQFTATNLIARLRSALSTRVLAKQPMPTTAQLEGIVPVGFEVTVPG